MNVNDPKTSFFSVKSRYQAEMITELPFCAPPSFSKFSLIVQ